MDAFEGRLAFEIENSTTEGLGSGNFELDAGGSGRGDFDRGHDVPLGDFNLIGSRCDVEVQATAGIGDVFVDTSAFGEANLKTRERLPVFEKVEAQSGRVRTRRCFRRPRWRVAGNCGGRFLGG